MGIQQAFASVYIQCLLSDISFYLSQSLIFVLSQVLPYDQLMQELDVMNVRELEDFLINECMYAVGIPLFRVYIVASILMAYEIGILLLTAEQTL